MKYDFKKNNVRSFSLQHKITEKTILKYSKEHKIPYSNRKITYEITKNCLGQYTFKTNVNKCSQDTHSSDMKDKASQCKNLGHQSKRSTTGVKNLTEFSKKYEKFFS